MSSILAFLARWLAVHLTATLVDGLWDERRRVDVVVVLGAEVFGSGRPSRRLLARLDAAKAAHDRGLTPRILVSGGVDAWGNSEAAVMRDVLLENGVDPAHVWLDEGGATTWHTARNTARLARQEGWTSVAAATHWYHVPRAKLALRRFGFREVTGVHTVRPLGLGQIRSVLRDCVAFYWYVLRWYPTSAPGAPVGAPSIATAAARPPGRGVLTPGGPEAHTG
ncbi:MAG: YdcF family protein [Acidimicrobiia bacterium]|nr:YdcF family protein [Acidimicrobiia bacterium]